jgi:hypothetical protein
MNKHFRNNVQQNSSLSIVRGAVTCASIDLSLVTAMMRLMPLAIPLSSSNEKATASPVLVKCVPPQNSTDMSDQAAFSGS